MGLERHPQEGCDCELEPALLPLAGRSRFRRPSWYEARKNLLLANLAPAMVAAHGVFDGPSIDFHQWAIAKREAARNSTEVREQFVRYIFGTLVSWGMHRMGEGGAKMPRFSVFRTSVVEHAWPSILDLWDAGQLSTREEWVTLCQAFHAIRASTTNSRLVSSSKVLAHLLPRSVCVIDRQYTLGFLGQRNTYANGLRGEPGFEWRLFREIHEQLFYPLIGDPSFAAATAQWPPPAEGQAAAMFETPLRAADTIIVGYQRSIGQEPDPGAA